MSVVIMFYFTSSMLNMFRTLIHPSSGACDFSIVSPHWSCVLVSMCVGSFGVAGLGWYLCSRLKHNCDFSIVSSHWLCVLVSMCVGVSVWLCWGGICVAG